MENSKNQNLYAEFTMSWTAYVRPALIFVGMLLFSLLLFNGPFKIAGVLLLSLAIALLTYNVTAIRRVRLYTDDHGVWVHRGVFPCERGTSGVKWRDLEDAVFYQGFASWLLKSYTIRVGHRFTKTSEIILTHIQAGNLAVEHINGMHSEILSQGMIE